MTRKQIKPAPTTGPVVNRCGCSRDLGPMRCDEGPSEDDMERFSDVTRTCSECGAELYDQAQVCWQCGHALESPRQMPVWAVVAAVAALVGLVVWVLL